MAKKEIQDLEPQPSNAELKKLILQATNSLDNWKSQVERNPNPRMVHSLKNIVSIIETLSGFTDRKIKLSYKALTKQMAKMVHEVADLNCRITSALDDDDFIDEAEEQEIATSLFSVIRAATDLLRVVQEGFGNSSRKRKVLNLPFLESKQ